MHASGDFQGPDISSRHARCHHECRAGPDPGGGVSLTARGNVRAAPAAEPTRADEPAPVFVDTSGRRRKRVQLVLAGAAVTCGGYVAAIGFGFAGGDVGLGGLLPFVQGPAKTAPTAKVTHGPGQGQQGGQGPGTPQSGAPGASTGQGGAAGNGSGGSAGASAGGTATGSGPSAIPGVQVPAGRDGRVRSGVDEHRAPRRPAAPRRAAPRRAAPRRAAPRRAAPRRAAPRPGAAPRPAAPHRAAPRPAPRPGAARRAYRPPAPPPRAGAPGRGPAPARPPVAPARVRTRRR